MNLGFDPEIFEKAAAKIERDGLYQGYYCPMYPNRPDEDCPMCPTGAINFVGNGDPLPGAQYVGSIGDKATTWMEDYAQEHDLIGGFFSVASWSDHVTRTMPEVVALLRTLAEGARRASVA